MSNPYAPLAPILEQRVAPLALVKQRLARPATALIVMASIQSVMVSVVLIGIAMQLVYVGPTVPDLVLFLLSFVQFISLLTIAIGTAKMGHLESYAMGHLSAGLACIPFFSPFLVLGIPFGVWALVLLSKAEVKAAFKSVAADES